MLNWIVWFANLGRKSGKGIFIYEANAKSREENQGAMEIMKRYATPPKQKSAAIIVLYFLFGE